MSLWSVQKPDGWEYYEVGGTPQHLIPATTQQAKIGLLPEELTPPIPWSATYVGNGPVPQGVIARSDGYGGRMVKHVVIAVGLLAFGGLLFWVAGKIGDNGK